MKMYRENTEKKIALLHFTLYFYNYINELKKWCYPADKIIFSFKHDIIIYTLIKGKLSVKSNTLYSIILTLITIIFLVISFLFIHQFTQQTNTQSSHQTTIQLAENSIHKVMKDDQIPGLSVALIHDNHVVLNKGYGMANQEKKIKATKHTQYEIASNTKAFTGLAILELAKQGKVDLDAPVSHYLPWLHFNYDGHKQDVTIKQLLSQTSGIKDDLSDEKEGEVEKDQDNIKDHVKSLDNATLVSEPGKAFHYANMNYNILGSVIESVSKTSYESYINQHYIKQLDMKQAYFKTEAQTKSQAAHTAQGYAIENGEPKADNPDYFKGDAPAAYLVSSTTDLLPWIKLQLDPPKNMQQVIQQSHQVLSKVKDDTNAQDYASGWFLNPKDHQVLHPGTLPNYSSFILLDTKQKNAVIILANLNGSQIPDLARTLNYQMVHFNHYLDISKQTKQHEWLISTVILLILTLSAFIITLLIHQFIRLKNHQLQWRHATVAYNLSIVLVSAILILSLLFGFSVIPKYLLHDADWIITMFTFSKAIILMLMMSLCMLILALIYGASCLLLKTKMKNKR